MSERASPSKTAKRVLAVVPALNEAGNVAAVVSEALSLSEHPDVLVVDDGSTDDTAAEAARAGAAVLRMPYNCGIGASVQAGVRVALEHGYDLVARFDGDGQHDPRSLARLLEPIESGRADFVLGSRYLSNAGYRSTLARRTGARWFGFLLRVFCRLKITDPTSGFWVANRRAATVLHLEHSPDYPEVDALVRLQRSGCTIDERPVNMRPRREGSSSIDWLRALYYVLKVTIALLIGRVRPGVSATRSDAAWSSTTKQSPS